MFMASSSSSSSTNLFVADHPVGVESRVQEVIQLLNTEPSEETRVIGICGTGGIGKTTIAKAVYNKIHHHFEAKSFLLNVRQVWEQDNGEVSLQQQLLSDIYKTTDIKKIETVESGKMILQEMLPQKRMLLVVDNVNEQHQLDALCISCKWFGQGSIIIITTRHSYMLYYRVYKMEPMNIHESLELFSLYAFKQPNPIEDFADLSREVVMNCHGLPLSLEVIGSFLLTTRRKTEWNSVLEKLQQINRMYHLSHARVQEIIRISFHGLRDGDVENMFLDIALNLCGMDQDDVIKILKDSVYYSAEIRIRVLLQRRLVTVDSKNRICMYGPVQHFGRDINCNASFNV
ncbi:disease resistance protein (TIR-NBS-LRR class) [Medicago truncatula]|uniref:Disease resistance protein (TIR-NBS-LRR class) n=1 Tax=Medicago truncatula TaxID=3880 RepID=A0A072TZD8_MEDTR|nr:disease resistance protein (TIR-NBS-LRR class) [Medicago truncatula]